jgi:hypothetical protein
MTRGQAVLVIVMAAIALGTIPAAGLRYGLVLFAIVAATAFVIARWQGRSRR